MAEKRETKPTRRERVVRILWAVGGALGAAVLAIIVNVVSEQINTALEVPIPEASACPDAGVPHRLDHQNLQVAVRLAEGDCWGASLDTLRPGDEFEVLVHFMNSTREQVDDVWLQGYLPEGFEILPNSSRLANSSNPDGTEVSDGMLDPGLNIGSYEHGANAYIIFAAYMRGDATVTCELTVHPISARIVNAPEPDSAWRSAAVVLPSRC